MQPDFMRCTVYCTSSKILAGFVQQWGYTFFCQQTRKRHMILSMWRAWEAGDLRRVTKLGWYHHVLSIHMCFSKWFFWLRRDRQSRFLAKLVASQPGRCWTDLIGCFSSCVGCLQFFPVLTRDSMMPTNLRRTNGHWWSWFTISLRTSLKLPVTTKSQLLRVGWTSGQLFPSFFVPDSTGPWDCLGCLCCQLLDQVAAANAPGHCDRQWMYSGTARSGKSSFSKRNPSTNSWILHQLPKMKTWPLSALELRPWGGLNHVG